MQTAVLKNSISIDVNLFIPFSMGPNFASIYKNGDSQYIVYFYCWTFLDRSWFKSVVYGVPNTRATFCWIRRIHKEVKVNWHTSARKFGK
jgi:hypothetical protein